MGKGHPDFMRPMNVVNLFKKQNGLCHYCDLPMILRRHNENYPTNYATKDHIIPKSRGGRSLSGNLVLACISCNSARANMPYAKFKRNQSEGQKP